MLLQYSTAFEREGVPLSGVKTVISCCGVIIVTAILEVNGDGLLYISKCAWFWLYSVCVKAVYAVHARLDVA